MTQHIAVRWCRRSWRIVDTGLHRVVVRVEVASTESLVGIASESHKVAFAVMMAVDTTRKHPVNQQFVVPWSFVALEPDGM